VGIAPPPLWRRRRFRTAILCLGVFVAGACGGAFVALETARRLMTHEFRNPEETAARMLNRLRADLDLTDDQAELLLPVLERHLRTVRDSIVAAHDSLVSQVEQSLTDEQKAVSRRLADERRRRFFGAKGERP
jgi:hypothetical protein